jgi:hypothetical protein
MSKLRIFVRRGALRRFHRLTRDAEGLPVTVEWDRREGQRRTDASPAPVETDRPAAGSAAATTTANTEKADTGENAEQRLADRRSDPPFTWTAAEFVVVNDPPDES